MKQVLLLSMMMAIWSSCTTAKRSLIALEQPTPPEKMEAVVGITLPQLDSLTVSLKTRYFDRANFVRMQPELTIGTEKVPIYYSNGILYNETCECELNIIFKYYEGSESYKPMITFAVGHLNDPNRVLDTHADPLELTGYQDHTVIPMKRIFTSVDLEDYESEAFILFAEEIKTLFEQRRRTDSLKPPFTSIDHNDYLEYNNLDKRLPENVLEPNHLQVNTTTNSY